MAFSKGNKLWEARSSHGRKPLWDNPEQLLEAATEYFQWVEDNPLWECKPMVAQGEIQDAPIAKMRAMTLDGLSVFLGIDRKSWNNYRNKDGFFQVVSYIETVIRDQKVTGAAAGLLNANIIAREVGLAEKSEHSGPNGEPIESNLNITFNPVSK